ncbi:hypothetical protein PSCICN_38290 [Pseudomonas cichorii]|uniref:hypothetical protein n=1 Tax=Pseudomonas cichorii TaxID=36746 RepID=UPI0019107CBB|nr:hypothetical protein [Pseudomonas cichorii]GFM83137.1 hypothetical protein PSCICN_38290 [Pseudomonas cichorii]
MNDSRDDFADFLDELVKQERIEGAAAGITKKVIAEGKESLSSKQSYVFQAEVLDEYLIDGCGRCSSSIPWSEMIDAYDNGGYCGYCAYIAGKDD